MSVLLTQRLEPQQLLQAYPVVRAAAPDLALSEWLAFARRHVGRGAAQERGIVTVQNTRRYILGLFTFRVVGDLCIKRVLQVENVIALGVGEPTPVVEALIRAAESVARERQCAAVHTILRLEEGTMLAGLNRLHAAFHRAGHERVAYHARKILT
jgi:hypothetical protein